MLWKPNRYDDDIVINLIELAAGTGDYRGRRAIFAVDHLSICRERDIRLGITICEQDFEQLVPVHDDLPFADARNASNTLSARPEGGTFPQRLT
jgi:hypothetical protein